MDLLYLKSRFRSPMGLAKILVFFTQIDITDTGTIIYDWPLYLVNRNVLIRIVALNQKNNFDIKFGRDNLYISI